MLWILLVIVAVVLVAAPQFTDREHKTLDAAARTEIGGDYIALSDGVTHYELGGPEDGAPVVLVHGFSTPIYGYDKTFELLTNAGFRVLRYDLFGRGYSDRPKVTYDPALFEGQLRELVEELGIRKPFALMGWSMGAIVASEYAKQHPDDVEKLILLDPAGLPIQLAFAARLVQTPIIGDYLFRIVGDAVNIAGCDENFYEPEKFPEFKEQFLPQLEYKGYKRALLSSLRNMPMGNNRETYRAVGNHDRPVLVIWGTEDDITPYRNHAELLELMPNAELLSVEGSGHGPHYETPEAVNPTLLEFVATSSAQR